MKPAFSTILNLAIVLLCLTIVSCSKEDNPSPADPVEANIKKYETVWDGIMNNGNLSIPASSLVYPPQAIR